VRALSLLSSHTAAPTLTASHARVPTRTPQQQQQQHLRRRSPAAPPPLSSGGGLQPPHAILRSRPAPCCPPLQFPRPPLPLSTVGCLAGPHPAARRSSTRARRAPFFQGLPPAAPPATHCSRPAPCCPPLQFPRPPRPLLPGAAAVPTRPPPLPSQPAAAVPVSLPPPLQQYAWALAHPPLLRSRARRAPFFQGPPQGQPACRRCPVSLPPGWS
jgi:hypothetical protein